MRTGFVVAPEPVRSALVAARQLIDWHGSLLIQAALAKFINEGHLARHIRKMRRIYANRRNRLVRCLEGESLDWLKLWTSEAGLHMAVSLKQNLSADTIAKLAAQLGVSVYSLGEQGLALGYGAIESDRISDGIELLMKVIKSL